MIIFLYIIRRILFIGFAGKMRSQMIQKKYDRFNNQSMFNSMLLNYYDFDSEVQRDVPIINIMSVNLVEERKTEQLQVKPTMTKDTGHGWLYLELPSVQSSLVYQNRAQPSLSFSLTSLFKDILRTYLITLYDIHCCLNTLRIIYLCLRQITYDF